MTDARTSEVEVALAPLLELRTATTSSNYDNHRKHFNTSNREKDSIILKTVAKETMEEISELCEMYAPIQTQSVRV
jgi:hypothetical protein